MLKIIQKFPLISPKLPKTIPSPLHKPHNLLTNFPSSYSFPSHLNPLQMCLQAVVNAVQYRESPLLL